MVFLLISGFALKGSKTVRLKVDTKDKGECWGKVEVCLDGACGGVCEDAWTDKKSDMLCKDLDCGSISHLSSVLPEKITISFRQNHHQQCAQNPADN